MIKLVKRYLYAYKIQFVLVMTLCLMQVGLQLILPQLTDQMLKKGVVLNDQKCIYITGIKMLGVTLAVSLCMVLASYFSAYVSGTFASKCRSEMFTKVCHFSEEQFSRFGVSTLTTRFTNDLTFLTFTTMMGMRTALTAPLLGVGAIIVAMTINWKLTIIVIVGVMSSILLMFFSQKHTAPLFAISLKSLDHMNLLFKEKLTGVRTIRAFNRQAYENQRMDTSIEETWKKDLRASNAVSVFIVAIQLLMNLDLVLVFFASSFLVRQQLMQAADLVKFSQYVMNFISSITAITSIIQALPRVKMTSERISEILEQDTVKDSGINKPNEEKRGEIMLKDVSYGYPGAQEKVLKDINLQIRSGDFIAILGTTGAGKTTLVSIIHGLIKDYQGSVMVDGMEVKNESRSTMSTIVSLAPQRSLVFQKSIFDNLRLSKDSITRDEAALALKRACADGFVAEKEEGIDFTLTQRGMNVSGGQRQRLSLARAVAKEADVYIFDDSFSALDTKTESLARSQILEALNDKTVIIVSQRIKTIINADCIYLLDNGQIVAKGSHEELLKTNKLYQEIYSTQFRSDGGEE